MLNEIKKQKYLPTWKEYKKAVNRMQMVYYAINHCLTWKQVHKKYWWTKISRREYYYWRNVALNHKDERIKELQKTRWYRLKVDKYHLKDKPWYIFLDRLPIPKTLKKIDVT